MSNGQAESEPTRRWEDLYKNVLFEADVRKIPRRIELAEHAVLDRLEDATCAKHKHHLEAGELLALRRAHRTLRALEQFYVHATARKMTA
jgi:hypothetical protein